LSSVVPTRFLGVALLDGMSRNKLYQIINADFFVSGERLILLAGIYA
jgi:hypothetical protein